MIQQLLYVDGEWRSTASTFTVTNPWDDGVLGEVSVAEVADVTDAVAAARRALDVPFPPYARTAALRRAVELMRERAEEFAQLLCAEAGKPITAARAEVGRAVETLDLSSDEARHVAGAAVPMDAVASGAGMLAFEIAEPVGVVAAITPFNFPLNLAVHKIGPALQPGAPSCGSRRRRRRWWRDCSPSCSTTRRCLLGC